MLGADDDARAHQAVEPFGENVRRDAFAGREKLAVFPESAKHEIADDHERPAVAQQIQRPGSGAIGAAVVPRWYRGEAPLVAGMKFSLLMGLFLFSVSTLANAAKINVNGLGSFILIQAAFHTLQFAAAGAVFGLIFGLQ
jgi:hypothetical protein